MEEIKPMSEDSANELISRIDSLKNSTFNFSEAVKPIMESAISGVIDNKKHELFSNWIKYALKYSRSNFWNRWYYKKKYFKAKEAMETFCIKLKEFEDGRN